MLITGRALQIEPEAWMLEPEGQQKIEEIRSRLTDNGPFQRGSLFKVRNAWTLGLELYLYHLGFYLEDHVRLVGAFYPERKQWEKILNGGSLGPGETILPGCVCPPGFAREDHEPAIWIVEWLPYFATIPFEEMKRLLDVGFLIPVIDKAVPLTEEEVWSFRDTSFKGDPEKWRVPRKDACELWKRAFIVAED